MPYQRPRCLARQAPSILGRFIWANKAIYPEMKLFWSASLPCWRLSPCLPYQRPRRLAHQAPSVLDRFAWANKAKYPEMSCLPNSYVVEQRRASTYDGRRGASSYVVRRTTTYDAPTSLPTCLLTYLPTYLPTCLPADRPTYLPTNLPMNQPT